MRLPVANRPGERDISAPEEATASSSRARAPKGPAGLPQLLANDSAAA